MKPFYLKLLLLAAAWSALSMSFRQALAPLVARACEVEAPAPSNEPTAELSTLEPTPTSPEPTLETNTTEPEAPTETTQAATETATAPAPEPTPEPLTYPTGAIRITEIYPSPPTGSSEWLELWNATQSTIALEGWTLKDASGATTKLAGTILAAGYFLVSDPKGYLNNSGDTVTLFDPAGNLIETVTYPTVKRGEAYTRDGETWTMTTTPTPLAPNVVASTTPTTETAPSEPAPPQAPPAATEVSEPTTEETAMPSEPTTEVADQEIGVGVAPSATHIASLSLPRTTKTEKPKTKKSSSKKSKTVHEVSLDEARELEKGSLVRTRAVVSVPPGILGSRSFYLAGSGMQVYLHGIEVPPLAIGDSVEIFGKLGSSGGETRIVVSKPDALTVVDHGGAPEPETLEIGEIGDLTEGWLVMVEGTVTEKLNGRFVLEDASGAVSVVLKAGTGIDQRTVSIGDTVRVTGIVSETRSGFRLLPRGLEDLVVVTRGVANDPPRPRFRVSLFTIVAAALSSVLIALVVRKQLALRRATPAGPLMM